METKNRHIPFQRKKAEYIISNQQTRPCVFSSWSFHVNIFLWFFYDIKKKCTWNRFSFTTLGGCHAKFLGIKKTNRLLTYTPDPALKKATVHLHTYPLKLDLSSQTKQKWKPKTRFFFLVPIGIIDWTNEIRLRTMFFLTSHRNPSVNSHSRATPEDFYHRWCFHGLRKLPRKKKICSMLARQPLLQWPYSFVLNLRLTCTHTHSRRHILVICAVAVFALFLYRVAWLRLMWTR